MSDRNYAASITELPPLSLYIHIPWCVRKCPYCDFNSHQADTELPIEAYLEALKQDLQHDKWMAQGRRISTIFFGGGTPSLLPNNAIKQIIQMIDSKIGIAPGAEITLEANPGTVEHHDFNELRETGVNRLSIGVQSFNEVHLKALGRIHNTDQAITAIGQALKAFDNLNIDLMHGLPDQSVEDALSDLDQAITLAPTHISWYQLTIEQNTEFYSRPPSLPNEEVLVDIFQAGSRRLQRAGFHQYETSAHGQQGRQAQHNLNYWQFGDYMAIGAGAHGKITDMGRGEIFRYQKTRLPRDYLNPEKRFTVKREPIEDANLVIEFMMNALRLNQGVDNAMITKRTGVPFESISPTIESLQQRGLLEPNTHRICPTSTGRLFLNNVLEAFI